MATNKTNFNSTETSQRLFAAFIASLPPGTKFDYKIIAKYLDTTESAIEHRFRPLKAQGEFFQRALQDANSGGRPMKQHLEEVLKIKTRDQIQKYFGASTEQGLAFQARAWKNNAKVLTDAVEAGEDPVVAFSKHLNGGGGGGSSTPKRSRAAPAAKTPGIATKRRKTATAAAATPAPVAATPKKPIVVKDETSPNDNVDSPEMNYFEMDLTDDSPRIAIKKEAAAAATPNRTPVAKEIASYRAQDAAAAAALGAVGSTAAAPTSSPVKAVGFDLTPSAQASLAANFWDLDTGADEDEEDLAGGLEAETPTKSSGSKRDHRSKSKEVLGGGGGETGYKFEEDDFDV
ncbi:hypothetical protein QBC38DRAFT_453962 [Podospora fimiseda]|uniref:Uncharacterized protein n=1 Tax=Podospora fimiseda TaxID=252190 RepID=A0AAN7BSB4_9PEZI|nr:hypothetical protein QBC38DRAFT_453962 [Podospora fimiseda]